MTTESPTVALDEMQADYQRLSLAAANGDKKAEAELTKLEQRMVEQARMEQRRAAAQAEQKRQEAVTAEQASEEQRQHETADHEAWLAAKHRAFFQVQDATQELVALVKIALDVSNEAHAAALRRGVPPGRSARNMLTDYIGWKLADVGLIDMPRPVSAMRQPLVPDKE